MAQPQAYADAAGLSAKWLKFFVQKRKAAAYILLGISAVLWAACVVLAFLPRWLEGAERWDYLPASFWAAGLAFTAGCGGFWHLLSQPTRMAEVDVARILVLAIGGLCGLWTTLLGVVLGWRWWGDLSSWLKAGAGTGASHVILALAAFFGGLALMFISLQLARTEGRANAVLRRLLYGYNTGLTGVLLLAILIVINVFVYLKVPQAVDFTASNIFSLSQRSQNILKGLEKPTKIYILMSRGDPLWTEVNTLLDNCRAANDKIEVEQVSPEEDQSRIAELDREFPGLERGLLVVYGSGAEANHRVIKREDLYSLDTNQFNPDANEKQKYKFKGEDALITQLDSLEEDKAKPIVYFTQGNGELDLNNSDASKPDVGLSLLRSRLEKRNYQVRPLEFSPVNKRVPDDAAIVVIARPMNRWSDYELQALENYMNPPDPKKPKGKLMILFDVTLTRQGTMSRTGLEDFVARFNVQVTDERILAAPSNLNNGNPVKVEIVASRDLADRNPVAAAFKGYALMLTSPRLVEPAGSRPAASRYDAEALFLATPRQIMWAESDLATDASRLARELLRHRQELEKKFSRKPLPVAVAVTETTQAGPHAFMRPPAEAKPRLVVFGDATLASNWGMTERGQGYLFDVLASCLDWLRERPASIGIQPKERDFFTFNPGTHILRLQLLPGVLLALAVAGLGTGVWLVRRR